MTNRWLLLTLLSLVLPAPARADDLDVARKHNRKAIEYTKQGDHRSAIMELQEAYAASPRPNILFNLGHAYELVSGLANVTDMGRAIEYYERYLTERKDAPDRRETLDVIAKLRAAIDTHEAESHAAEVKAKPPEAAQVPEAPPPAVRRPAPESGGASSVLAAPPEVSPTTRSRSRRALGATVLGVGVVLVAGGAILLGAAPSIYGDAPSASTIGKFYSAHDRAGEMQLAGALLGGVGVAAAVAGVVFLALPAPSRKSNALWIAPSLGGATVGGAF